MNFALRPFLFFIFFCFFLTSPGYSWAWPTSLQEYVKTHAPLQFRIDASGAHLLNEDTGGADVWPIPDAKLFFQWLRQQQTPQTIAGNDGFVVHWFEILYAGKSLVSVTLPQWQERLRQSCPKVDAPCAYDAYQERLHLVSVAAPFFSYEKSLTYQWTQAMHPAFFLQYRTQNLLTGKAVALTDVFAEDTLAQALKTSVVHYLENHVREGFEPTGKDKALMAGVQNAKTLAQVQAVLRQLETQLPSCTFAWSQSSLDEFVLRDFAEKTGEISVLLFSKGYSASICYDSVHAFALVAKPKPEILEAFRNAKAKGSRYWMASQYFDTTIGDLTVVE